MPRLLIALCLFVFSAGAHADAVATLEHFFQSTTTLSGRFTQKVYETNGPEISHSSGTFELARPGRFRWSYVTPHRQVLVSNGHKLWIYDKGLAQVTVRAVGKTLGRAPIMLLGGGAPLSDAYTLSDDGTRNALAWVKLVPKDTRNSQFQSILLGLHAGKVVRMVMFDQFGHRTVIDFSAVKRNQTLPASDFRFVPPKGVDVVNML
ncbi:outer membrane lipoprotein chaperone LolA [Acidihalobacter ferrooxydans]|nr:outer membrane lipoprotein chaperone LolA [Acidihalobacter ferrooxydans]